MGDQGNTSEDGDARSNVFENALQSWVEIDLSTLQRKLDEQGLEIKQGQKDSLLSRKTLASRTKEFKKLESSEKLEQIKSLLKLYQNEIDSLTTKNKNLESYFFGMYRLIGDAPDPRPLLEMSIDSVIESKEAVRLKIELAKTEEELAKRADYEQLKQRLLSNEQRSAEILSIKLKAKENECQSLLEEKEANWKEKEKQFEDQLRTAQKQIEELRTSKEVSEIRLNNQNKSNEHYEGASASVLAELDMVRRDAELSKKRIFELERRNESLRRDITQSQNDMDIKVLQDKCDQKVSEMESENVLLVANLNQIRKQKEEIAKRLSSKIDSLGRENAVMAQEVKNLKSRLDKTSDYEQVKEELHLLRQIEFGHGEEDDDATTSKATTKLDSIVIERNKTMTKELAQYRSEHADLTSKVSELEDQLKYVTEELRSSKQLNEKLENDLTDLQESNSSNKFNDNSSLISGMSRITRSANFRNGSIVSGISGERLGNDDSSILPIITKQRDRFREKNNELEDELRKSHNLNNELKRQINTLKQDNEELYERGRYLQSLQTPGTRNITTTSSGRKFLNPKPNVSDLESNHVRYQQDYERKLHPIEQFRIKEQERINSRLSPLERLFISLTRAVLATRATRMIFFVYCLGLHVIVMAITIYAMNLHSSLIPEVGLNLSTGGKAMNQVQGERL
ncbi:hypothetical protein KGF56_004771 [Candida oxycetoniae]|uniref:Protein CASP n=1 Tax=Candida oxycetoniae TaxID=497107 RepID=A0AAI9WVF8_9ASCO|nr:uncharacterized protein KGF56_004771 [Candida oxycetoniae]KAI3402363.2 hypothetical protein KGF56_004771 [Candida oxycetoniae]